jgi:hypothetical protein
MGRAGDPCRDKTPGRHSFQDNLKKSRLIPRHNHDRDDKQCCDQGKRAIQFFRPGYDAGVERKHDTSLLELTYFRGLPRLAKVDPWLSAA